MSSSSAAAALPVFSLETVLCWIMSKENGQQWKEISPKSSHPVHVDETFRLLPINPKNNKNVVMIMNMMMMPPCSNNNSIDEPCVRFTLCQVNPVGSASFDQQYLKLLHCISNKGKLQDNKKGKNWTLAEPYSLEVDLRCDTKNLLPIATLRCLHQGRPSIMEALWYLRGEDHIRFLQCQQQHFWDQQADQERDGWVGYNYGLLTNYDGVNQLQSNVIERLVQKNDSSSSSEASRNMVCTLTKPNEDTVQNACTCGVQFSVTRDYQCGDGNKTRDFWT
jgi:Thymidylate synthase